MARALRLLLLALVALCASRAVDAATSRSVSHGSPSPRRAAVALEDEDDEDDDADGWDFLSDASIVAAADAQRRAVPCAASLDASYINDDYCDCADGSDEPLTGACALVTHGAAYHSFNCQSGDGQRIAAAFVRDGVCDCCDGSDEAPGVCANTCAQRRDARIATLRERQQLVGTARVTRAEYASVAATRVPQFHSQFEEIASRATALQRAFQYKQQLLEKQVEETGEQPSAQQLHELRSMYAQLQHWQYHGYVLSRLVAPETFDSSLDRAPFAALVGACFPFTANEKQLKGGSSNVIPREYVIVFCPFQNVTQTEPAYAHWQRAERESKTGVHEDVDEAVEAPTQPPISMGIWNQWEEAVTEDVIGDAFADVHAVVARQRFDHGDACANGQERAVNVEIFCGNDNRVLSVEEPAMCEYALRFETPAACLASHETALASMIQSLTSHNDEMKRVHEEL